MPKATADAATEKLRCNAKVIRHDQASDGGARVRTVRSGRPATYGWTAVRTRAWNGSAAMGGFERLPITASVLNIRMSPQPGGSLPVATGFLARYSRRRWTMQG